MPVCLNCKRETRIENRFCPNCGSQLWLSWDGAVLAKLFAGVEIETGKRVYKLAMYRLWRIGKDLGFHSITEYAVPDLVQEGRRSLVDVVWKSDEGIEFAFEIRTKAQELDIVTTMKDTTKLQNLSARKKFVVNVSKKTGKAYFNQITGEPKRVIPQKAYDLSEIRKKHLRAYESWTQDEDLELTKYYREGLSVSQIAEKHQRKSGAIRSRLKKLGLVESRNMSEDSKVEAARLVTFLVKSEKHGKICIAGVDENKRWVRPIKPGGFVEEDIMMNNGETISLFDVVEMKFNAPYPIKHHTENMLFAPGSSINLAMKLGEKSRKKLLSEIADPLILDEVYSGEELYDKMVNFLHQSLALAGPVDSFEIQSNIVSGKNHPRIWIVNPFDKQRMFYITCTDIGFCKFIKNKLTQDKGDGIISSQDVAELRGKQTYFAIGITGDSLDENGETKDGRYAPPGSSIQPRYWPMVVSVLTVPNYSSEDQK